jgi:hypothetical protein
MRIQKNGGRAWIDNEDETNRPLSVKNDMHKLKFGRKRLAGSLMRGQFK